MLLTKEEKQAIVEKYGDKSKKKFMPNWGIDTDFSAHEIGDEDCSSGWCGGASSYPRKCKCGGLIHAEFGDEDWDGYWLYKRCDRCGEEYVEM